MGKKIDPKAEREEIEALRADMRGSSERRSLAALFMYTSYETKWGYAMDEEQAGEFADLLLRGAKRTGLAVTVTSEGKVWE